MKSLKLIALALGASTALTLSATTAFSADPVDESEMVTPFNWTGFHIGAGIGSAGAQHNSGVELFDYSPSGLFAIGPFDLYSIGLGVDFGGEGAIATIEGGYDYQVNDKLVLGIQADYTVGEIDTEMGVFAEGTTAALDTSLALGYELTATESWSVLGKVGYVANPYSMIYGVAGYTETEMEADITLTSVPGGTTTLASYDYQREGVSVGAGIETAVQGGWTAKMEYRRTEWDHSQTYDFVPGVSGLTFWDDAIIHSIRGVVSYRFGNENADQNAPVMASNVDWTGFTVGAAGGLGTARHNRGLELDLGGVPIPFLFDTLDTVGGDLDLGADGTIGSIEVGYNHQVNDQFVIGVQADYTFSGMDTQASLFGDVCYEFPLSGTGPADDDCSNLVVSDTPDLTYTLNTGDSWSVLGRIGWLANPETLIYGLAGYTRQEMDADVTISFETAAGAVSEELIGYSYERDALTLGVGMETMLDENLSAKIEYRNTNWTDTDSAFLGVPILTSTEDSRIQTFRFGLTWHLN